MKITRMQVTPMRNRGMLLEMHTDEGLVGYGSPMNYEHGRTVERAVHDMVERTSTAIAPWHLIAGEDKRYARIQVLKSVCKALKGVLGKDAGKKDD